MCKGNPKHSHCKLYVGQGRPDKDRNSLYEWYIGQWIPGMDQKPTL